MVSQQRPLPLVEAPVALASPRVARLLLDTWDRAVTPALRSSGEAVPDDLADFIDACRVVATRRTSAVGSAVDEGAEVGAGSAHATTASEAEQREATTEEAGRRLGLSGRQVRNLLDQGRLAGRKVGGTWLVNTASLEEHSAARAASG